MSTQSKRIVRAYLLLFVLLAALSFLSLAVGSVRVSAADILVALGGKEGTDMTRHILFDIRLPRMLAALILGGALSVSGFLLQTFFSNPIAGPFVLGISSGAKLAVSIFMILFLGQGLIMNSWVMIGAAFLGLFFALSLFLVYKKEIAQYRWFLISAIIMIPLAYIASESGWIVAEIGRQPWTIQDLLPVSAAISDIEAGSVATTFFIFLALFTTMLAVEISILMKQIKKGPEYE